MKNKRRTVLVLACTLALGMMFSFSACGKKENAENTGSNGKSTEMVENGITAEDGSKILIAYFTAAENSGVDAVSSASY